MGFSNSLKMVALTDTNLPELSYNLVWAFTKTSANVLSKAEMLEKTYLV